MAATVRSQEKADWINKKFGNHKSKYSIEFVEDIAAAGAFDETFKKHSDVKYVIHTASPFYYTESDPENSILKPAINGTTNILKAIKAYAPSVEHVVITSSFAAILDPSHLLAGTGTALSDPTITYTEKSWCSLTYKQAAESLGGVTYIGSKKLAEESFWKFIKEEDVKFSGTTINPPYVFGPVLQQIKNVDALNTSSKILYKLLRSGPEDVPNNSALLQVDVRDVALAHVLAIEKKEAVGQRWFVTPGFYTTYDALAVLKKHFPEYKGPSAPSDYDRDAFITKFSKINNHVTNEQSGLEYHTLEQTLVDSFRSLIEAEKSWSSTDDN